MANWVPLWLHRLGSPPVFYRFAGAVRPWAFGLALLLGAVALYGGLVLAPADYQQGDMVRIIESRPLSKLKRWTLGEVIRRAPQVGEVVAEVSA